MPSLVLRETIPPLAKAPAISTRPARQARRADGPLEGVLIFAGLSLTLMVLAAIFAYLGLPPPVF